MTSRRLGAGCLIAFALPFAAFGLGAFGAVVHFVRAGESAQRIFLLACFALAFTVAGAGLIAAALWGYRRDEGGGAASHRIDDQSRAWTVGLWMICIFWNAIASPTFVFIPAEIRKGNYAVLLAFLFPLVGFGILVAAVRATLRAIRFHRSTLVLADVPVPLGGALRGHVEVPYAPLADAETIVARLSAIRRRSSGKSSSETVEWQDEHEIPRGSLARTPYGVTIPIHIAIPHDAPATDSWAMTRTYWRLVVDAEVPGIDYSATFEVPVARTVVPNDLRARTAHVPPPEPREPSGYTSRQTAHGREIVFPPFRARAHALAMLCFTLIWCAAVGVLVVVDAPLFFPFLFALFAIVLIAMTLELFFASTRIVLGGEQVTIHRKLFTTKETRLARKEIASARARIGSQSGNRPYYDIEVQTSAGKKIKAAKYIRSKREAEWVASQIRGAVDSRR